MTNNKGKPNATDKLVGALIRTRRRLLGMSQGTLGDAIGVTYQQVQKYENSTNRIGAGRLKSIAQALEVPVEFFFEQPKRASKDGSVVLPVLTRDEVGMLLAYRKITSATDKKEVLKILQSYL